MHAMETTASTSTKFCTAIKTTKYYLRVVPTHLQQIQDGGRPPFWKKDSHISAMVWLLTMKFRTWRIIITITPSTANISNF